MFKRPTKKQLLIRRVILSSVATLSVIIIAASAILFMLGYRLDSGNGRLEQGALLQFDSTPSGADVFIDGASIGSRTATKQTVIAGTHSIKMTRYGYQDWRRTLELDAGTLTWLDYTRFVPVDRPVQAVAAYDTLSGVSFSPDYKWAIAQTVAANPRFQLVDLRSEAIKTSTFELASTSYTQTEDTSIAHSFSVRSWDSGSRYVLVQHVYSDQVEWIVIDTQNPQNATNITKLLDVRFQNVQFAGTNGTVLYGLTSDGSIRKIDVSAATISRAFVSHAESFAIYDNTIISYVGLDANDASKRVAGIYRDGDEAAHVLRTVSDPDAVLKISTTRYFGKDYVGIVEGNVVTLLQGSYPSSSSQDNSSLKTLTTFELSGTISKLSFSPKGDYLFAQSGESYKSYELEHNRLAAGMITVSEGKAASNLSWLDIAHLWNDDDGKLVMRDFDGSNTYEIMKVAPGFQASLSQNGRFFYAVGSTDDGGYQLQRVKMILD